MAAQVEIFSDKKIITVSEALEILKRYARERYIAVSIHPQAPNYHPKITAIDDIIKKINNLQNIKDYYQTALQVLTLERNFLFVAPRKNMAVFNSYADRISAIMAQFRELARYLENNPI